MTDQPLDVPAHVPARQGLGRWMSLAMVVGTMIGSGIYLLPATTAAFGPNLLVAFAVTIGGTMCLAFAMAALAARLPGGPFVYIEAAFGETAAFLTLWSYVVSQWTGVAAVAVAVAGAIGHVVPAAAQGPGMLAVGLGTILSITAVNLFGPRSAGSLQIVATLIKLVPLLLVVVIVLLRLGGGTPLEPLANVPVSVVGVGAAAALMLFSLTGFEAAAVTSNVTDDSARNVPLATVWGTGFTGLVYLFATVAALMILPSAMAMKSSAPFADAIAPIMGPVAGSFVAAIAAISAYGTCNALLLLSAEVVRALSSAHDLPPMFARLNRHGAPAAAIILGAVIAAVLVFASASKDFVSVYVFIALISTVATLVLYVMCALAALKIGALGGRAVIGILAVIYGIAMFFGAGLEPTLWGFALMAAGLPIRWISRRAWPSIPSPANEAAVPRG